jgi:hypothetical protein
VRFLSYQRKEGDPFFLELLVPHVHQLKTVDTRTHCDWQKRIRMEYCGYLKSGLVKFSCAHYHKIQLSYPLCGYVEVFCHSTWRVHILRRQRLSLVMFWACVITAFKGHQAGIHWYITVVSCSWCNNTIPFWISVPTAKHIVSCNSCSMWVSYDTYTQRLSLGT